MTAALLLPPNMIRDTFAATGGAVVTEPWFSDKECAKIIRVAEREGNEPGKTGNGMVAKISDYRRSRIHWLIDREKWKWAYDRIHHNISRINRMTWKFDLRQPETIQFSRYDDYDKGHYDWHFDSTGSQQIERKLSFSIQLSDPRYYDGGALTLWPDNEMTRQRGCAIIFPSFQPHKVGPVESNTRYSLVGWVLGPPFR